MNSTFFTVVIPTRNRPELFELALKSVLSQSFKNIEVVVVNDGTDPEFIDAYKALESKYTDKIKFVYQIKRPNGHGQSYSMNTGALLGSGEYLAFLDDDDYWTDSEHLKRAYDSIQGATHTIDAYYSNQDAYFSDGSKQTKNVWVEDLVNKVHTYQADDFGNYEVDAEFLMTSNGFAHLNCSIVRRELYLSIKGMDEGIRYECDRDIYLRVVDAAKQIIYCPKVVSKHFIPDAKKSNNMSTLVSDFEKRLFQITVLEKAILLANKRSIKQNSSRYLGYIYQHISASLVKAKRFSDAKQYAQKALSHNYSLRWQLYCWYLTLRSLGDN